MTIASVHPLENYLLRIVTDDGRTGIFDVKPYLDFEAFQPLQSTEQFAAVSTGGYFIEWQCGADLSADTIEANWQKANDQRVA